jgi:hypothetical protein
VRTHGEDVDDRQTEAQAEVQGAGIHALRALRPSAFRLPEIQDLPDLFP